MNVRIQPEPAPSHELANATQVVIDGLARVFTDWMREFPDLLDEASQDELVARIDAWTKQEIIDGYTRGEITDEQAAALIHEHGLVHA